MLDVRPRRAARTGPTDASRAPTPGRPDQAAIRALLAAHDDELRRIARELHDVAGQALTGVKLMLDGIRRDPARLADTDLQESISTIDRAMRDIRELAMDLRPAVLDDIGLAAAIRSHSARQAHFGGFRTYVTTDVLPEDLDPAVASACVRILQEALTNVIRHARATRVRVSLRNEGQWLTLRVDDDGVGIDARRRAASTKRGDFARGIIGMTERAAAVGGDLVVRRGRRGGTRVEAQFPIKARSGRST